MTFPRYSRPNSKPNWLVVPMKNSPPTEVHVRLRFKIVLPVSDLSGKRNSVDNLRNNTKQSEPTGQNVLRLNSNLVKPLLERRLWPNWMHNFAMNVSPSRPILTFSRKRLHSNWKLIWKSVLQPSELENKRKSLYNLNVNSTSVRKSCATRPSLMSVSVKHPFGLRLKRNLVSSVLKFVTV